MKRRNIILICLCLLFAGLWGCMDDKGNYSYDFENVSEIEIDTTGMDKSQLWATWNIGDTIIVTPKIKYNKPENLVYSWLILPYNYQAETVGNSLVYPPADTICRTLELNYIVSLEPGKAYQLYLTARDTTNGLSTSMRLNNYLSIPEAGAIFGIYCLQEKEGRIDIDVFGTAAGLIFGEFHVQDYWSSVHPEHPLTGKARSIYYSGSGDWFYIFTEAEGLRCSPSNLIIMDSWEEMFYEAPDYNPEAFVSINNSDFLINNGRLHYLPVRVAGDRKFPAALSGEYELAPYLASETRNTWRPTAGAINAYQIVFDKNTNGFRPFFNQASQLSAFSESIADAVFDVNRMQGELIYTTTVNGGETMAIMKRDGAYWMDIACFYDVKDEGNLAISSHPLSGCQDINKASMFLGDNGGSAMFYTVGNTLYSYSYTTGQTDATKLWSGSSSEEITCMTILPSGGFPTGGRVLWIAVWDKQSEKGKIIEFEFSPQTGKIEDMFGPMFGASGSSPRTFEGYGKVISMVVYM